MSSIRLHLNGAEVATIELVAGQTYSAGRSSSCQIQLGEHPGISRQHFSISEEDGNWVVRVTSKMGELVHSGERVSELVLASGTMFKVPPYDFFFVSDESYSQKESDYTAESNPDLSSENDDNQPVANPPALMATINNESASSSSNYDEPYEATMVGRIEAVPYLRIVNQEDGSEETLRLEGSAWTVGREGDVRLDDLKSSRRHFELSSSPTGYFITDLGSSNGTLLNGSKLKANDPTQIRSGDIISVGNVTLHFEVRDPNFKNKLVVLPPSVQMPPNELMVMQPQNLMPYPYTGQGGVVPLDQNGMPMYLPGGPGLSPGSAPKKGLDFSQTRTKILAAVAAALVVIAVVFSGGGETSNPSQNAPAGDMKTAAFNKLLPPQKKMIRESYQLGLTLQMQSRWQLALEQYDKIHNMLPEGYEASLAKAEEAKIQVDSQLQRIALEEELRAVEENKRKVDTVIANCRPKVPTAPSVDAIEQCLAEARMLEPDRADIQMMIAQVQARIEEANRMRANEAEYRGLINRRRALYEKAKRTDRPDQVLEAIAAYESFIKSTLPDPEGFEAQAKARISELRSGLSKEITRRIASAESMYKKEKHKEALAELGKARAVDPGNSKVLDLSDQITRELNERMQVLYSDSVLEEGLGNINDAKEKWRQILEIDRPGGVYYLRAKSKLRQYGSMTNPSK